MYISVFQEDHSFENFIRPTHILRVFVITNWIPKPWIHQTTLKGQTKPLKKKNLQIFSETENLAIFKNIYF